MVLVGTSLLVVENLQNIAISYYLMYTEGLYTWILVGLYHPYGKDNVIWK